MRRAKGRTDSSPSCTPQDGNPLHDEDGLDGIRTDFHGHRMSTASKALRRQDGQDGNRSDSTNRRKSLFGRRTVGLYRIADLLRPTTNPDLTIQSPIKSYVSNSAPIEGGRASAARRVATGRHGTPGSNNPSTVLPEEEGPSWLGCSPQQRGGLSPRTTTTERENKWSVESSHSTALSTFGQKVTPLWSRRYPGL